MRNSRFGWIRICLRLALIPLALTAFFYRPAYLLPLPPEFEPHVPQRAYDYSSATRLPSLIGYFWSLAAPIGFVLLGFHRTLLRQLKDPQGSPKFRTFGTYVLGFLAFDWLWTLPFGIYGWSIERRYGFSHESFGHYLWVRLVGSSYELLFAGLLFLVGKLAVRHPKKWVLFASFCALPVIVGSIILQPVVFAPMTHHYTPMALGPLKERIEGLAAQAGIAPGRIFVENTATRTTKVNAYVTGIGPTARIVLNDTALQTLPEDQIIVMVGHEIGHYAERHVLIGAATGAVGAGLMIWFFAWFAPRVVTRFSAPLKATRFTDLGAVPAVYLLISLLSFVQSPVASAISRSMETRAGRLFAESHRNARGNGATLHRLRRTRLFRSKPSGLAALLVGDSPDIAGAHLFCVELEGQIGGLKSPQAAFGQVSCGHECRTQFHCARLSVFRPQDDWPKAACGDFSPPINPANASWESSQARTARARYRKSNETDRSQSKRNDPPSTECRASICRQARQSGWGWMCRRPSAKRRRSVSRRFPRRGRWHRRHPEARHGPTVHFDRAGRWRNPCWIVHSLDRWQPSRDEVR